MTNKTKKTVVIVAVCIVLLITNLLTFCFMGDKINMINNSLLNHYTTAHSQDLYTPNREVEVFFEDGYGDDYYGIVQSDGSIKLVERK